MNVNIPNDYRALNQFWNTNAERLIQEYQQRKSNSFIPGLLPEQALKIPALQLFNILKNYLGEAINDAIRPNYTVKSPLSEYSDSNWLKTTNMVGINVRTIGSFWNILKYVLTIPKEQQSIHILPIWEPGVVASLYGMSSWNINPEFYSIEMAALFPGLNTVEKQLKVVVNLLHAMGRIVGLDVIPHCDRYSEIVLANPSYFEWLQRQDLNIINHDADLHLKIQQHIFLFLRIYGSATRNIPFPKTAKDFFSEEFPEENRLNVLFGATNNVQKRLRRRDQIIQHLYDEGYETVPATMAPPYRGIAVDPRPDSSTIDIHGRVWRDYRITRPEKMSRVFGPLTRYKLYERRDNNRRWKVDFARPRTAVWDYVCKKYGAMQATYNFDFMRGDMSHVQMRLEGVPSQPEPYYDLHQAVKTHVQKTKPYFGYFAETFIAPENTMGYGDEIDHLEMSDADSTLGDLQSMVLGTAEFLQALRYYYDILNTRTVTPNMTVMTADKDDPRFDKFYRDGNEARLFMAFFLTDMPSYMGLGFETRDVHIMPAPNEHYTKLYVFQELNGPKATKGPYIWGKNAPLFHNLTRIRQYAAQILLHIDEQSVHWLLPPDAKGYKKVIAWTQADKPQYVFVVNLDLNKETKNVKIPFLKKEEKQALTLSFSTHPATLIEHNALRNNEKNWTIEKLKSGEGQVFVLSNGET